MPPDQKSTYINPDAKTYSLPELADAYTVRKFHGSLPQYTPTPLVPLEELGEKVGVKSIFVKDEGNRLGHPSFKILGLAALLNIASTEPASIGLNSDSVVVILGTEGSRPYFDSL
ncbi:hypothetical protein V502_09877 [Pseudogymnoascus sp. VKM F-4520 (FW-2644)]|nr:hypothetical protein V502_09877 [Pseudogymnoascus sp. VKM F-4520 (FW-2644)]